MAEVQIRRATAEDQAVIRQWVRDEQLDPTALHWSQFVVAELDGEMVGIGQIRPHRRCRELGSLIVRQAYRRRGIGAQIVAALLAAEPGDVYLECLDEMAAYYARFGFEPLPWWQAPMPLKLKAGLGNLASRLFGYQVVTMRRPRPPAGGQPETGSGGQGGGQQRSF